MSLKELGGATELRYQFNQLPRENALRGILTRERYRAALEKAEKEMEMDIER